MEKADIDFFLSPTSIGEEPPKIHETKESKQKSNPVYEYKKDYFTVFPNSAGTPCMTIPF